MIKRRILLMTDLGWQVKLNEVSGQAGDFLLAKSWEATPNDELIKLVEIFSGRRFNLGLAGAIGEDEFSQLLLNWCDRKNIDTTYVRAKADMKLPLTIQLRSKIRQKDDLAIAIKNTTAINAQELYGLKELHDFYFINYQTIDLSWLNEALHQARLNQAQTSLHVVNLLKSEFGRFKILLEDVSWLMMPWELALKIFGDLTDGELAVRFKSVVKNTVVYTKNKIIVVCDDVLFVVKWNQAKIKLGAQQTAFAIVRELMSGKRPNQALMVGLVENCASEDLLPEINIMEQKI